MSVADPPAPILSCDTCYNVDETMAAPACTPKCLSTEFWNPAAGPAACETCTSASCVNCIGGPAMCATCTVDAEINDLDNLDCGGCASGFTIMMGDKKYCRTKGEIYVNPDSTKTFELGTKMYPYKTLESAFIEVWNYWTDMTQEVKVLVMESTFNYVYYQEKPLHIYTRDKFTLTTYSNNADPAYVPLRAKIHVTNANSWATQTGTKFNLMGINPTYDDAKAVGIKGEETKARTSSWYAIVVIRSNFVFEKFDVTNELKLKDDDYAFINPINLGSKILEISHSDFTMYGTVMVAFTTLQFTSQTVVIDTENLVGGFVFVISCDPIVDVVVGEVLIDNLRLDGKRVELFKYGGIYMTGPQNFTI